MNTLKRFALKLLSSPTINMHESYKFVRQLQKVFVTPSKSRFQYLDQKIYSADQSHEIPIRIFRPKKLMSSDIILFFHGGGWVLGNIDTYTKDCRRLADQMGRIVLAVDYLKAPENPYPAGFEDCYHVAQLLLSRPDLTGIKGARNIIIVGNSAGGNLAAAVSLRLRNEGKPLPSKQILINPVTYWRHDEASPFKSVEENGYDYGLTAKKMQEYMEMYEPDEVKRQNPYIAPLMTEDFSNQPDTLVISSEFDPLRDEGEVYGYMLLEAGNQVEIMRAKDTVHNFLFAPLNEGIIDTTYFLIKDYLENHLRRSDIRGESES
ncbi:alpha/beta hydrolase [Aerococcaceae bacterium INB8]|uniref:Alpha/beta hydrolase n=1 Tax=Ruoffia halotolerans TaxID=2748684 RepID=A0A839A4C3_9LACT|nr:alpha/beta hydrolase [Ruoffia halotolerans]MBA5728563.1 alpha/beta hydrolase [Ruoffia halotolerans]